MEVKDAEGKVVAVASLIKEEQVVDTVEVMFGYRMFHVKHFTGFWLKFHLSSHLFQEKKHTKIR